MSVREENNMQPVDIENFDLNNDVYRKTYGDAIIDDAESRTERMRGKMNTNTKFKSSKKLVNEGLTVRTSARLSEFSREKMYPGDWNESCLNVLESWYDSCETASEEYAAAARSARTKHRFISIPTIVAGTAATALSFFSAGETCDAESEDTDSIKYGVAILTSIVSVLGGISTLYSFKNKVSACINASGNFKNLARRAQVQIFLPPNLRAHSELVLSEISAEFSNLTSNSPLL